MKLIPGGGAKEKINILLLMMLHILTILGFYLMKDRLSKIYGKDNTFFKN